MNGGDAWNRVAVADRATVQRWRKMLGAAAARCKAMVPDYLALPIAPGVWSIDAGDEVIRARLGIADGFTAEPALALRMLDTALKEAEAAQATPRVVLLTGPARALVIPLLQGVTIASESDDLPGGLQPRVLAHGEMTVDFARDPRADAEVVERQVRRLIWPVTLLMAGALGWAGATWLQAQVDLALAQSIRAETVAAVRRDLLPSGPILDLRVQVAREIDARRGGTRDTPQELDPLDIMRLAGPVLAASQATVQTLAFGAVTDGLMVEVSLNSFRALDELNTALSEAGLSVTLERSSTDDGGVSAELVLGEVAP
jgi:general secretion pathway protein L